MEPRAYSLQDFELLEVERKGGMSRIRKATLVGSRDACALKFSDRYETEDSAATSFNRELSALGCMEHSNIVRMIGIGSGGTERFIALEWLDETLADRIESTGPMGWDLFYELIGRPLLTAIQYAHSRGYVHRDLKPQNVMFNRIGVPKITDFGISRSVVDVRLGHTFAQAGSHPWTPPEADDGIESERRDIYSWGALCVACLTGRIDFKLSAHMRDSVSRLGDSAPRKALESCLSDLPKERPVSATALLWDLDDYHRQQIDGVLGERLIGVELLPQAHRQLAEFVPEQEDPQEQVLRLFSDFQASCEICCTPDGNLEFQGAMFSLIGRRAASESPWLMVTNVRPAAVRYTSAQSVRAAVRFVERAGGAVDTTQSRINLAFFEEFLRSYSEREKEEQKRRDEERYLIMLQDVIAARMRALRYLPEVEYSDGKWEGGEFAVVIDGEALPTNGDKWVIRAGGVVLVFEVVRTSRGRTFLRPVGPRRGHPPQGGLLQVDTLAQRRALERQDEAVKALRGNTAVLPALKRLILKPETADVPESGGRPLPDGLSPDKIQVLDAALGLRQLLIVQGPPGTGKTKLITEVVRRYLQENPGSRVLLAAQTHIAIDHVIEKLLQFEETAGKIVRIARADEDKVSEKAKDVLLHRCLMRWCATTAEASREFVRQRGKRIGLDAGEIELSIRLETLILGYERLRLIRESLAREESRLSLADKGATGEESAIGDVESATVVAMTVEELEIERRRLDTDIDRLRDELRSLSHDGRALADLSEDALLEWSEVFRRDEPAWAAFKRELELQVAWLDLLGQLRQFEDVVLRSASVVAGTCVGLASNEAFSRTNFDLCIIDEASKATATEALIPMVRSHRCLVVGDPRQLPPFDWGPLDLEGYVDSEVNETLLDYLITRLPEPCVHELTHQHRMCKSIGELVSHAFYGKRLVNERPDSERAPWIRKKFPKAVVWMDSSGGESKRGRSYVNRTEQDIILNVLGELHSAAKRTQAQSSVAVIAGYAAQAQALDARIQKSSFPTLSIEVATVDSFQGRESDACIFSVTLSNTRDYLGFLRSVERLNVALSRSKDLLIIVGDQDFCYNVPGNNPFPGVIDYIEAHPDTCESKRAGQ